MATPTPPEPTREMTGAAGPPAEPAAAAPPAGLVAVTCPRCGSALTLGGGERVVACHSCGGRSLLSLQPPRPVYYVEPAMNAAAATASVRAFLRRPPNAPRLLATSTLLPPRLYFVPYHHITGRRVGVAHRQVPQTVLENPSGPLDTLGGSSGLGSEGLTGSRVRVVEHADTKVMIADVQAFIPAFGGRRWDLVEFDAASARLGAVLNPADVEALQRRATVLSATVPMEGAEKGLVQPGPGSRIVAVQRGTVLFPFWLVPFQHEGARYEVIVAATAGGKVVWATTPGDRSAPTSLRLLALVGGFLLGAGLRGVVAAGGLHLPGASPPRTMSLVFIVAGAGMAAYIAQRLRGFRAPTYRWRGATPIADNRS